jgi:exopolysaccharide biosynthesis protein
MIMQRGSATGGGGVCSLSSIFISLLISLFVTPANLTAQSPSLSPPPSDVCLNEGSCEASRSKENASAEPSAAIIWEMLTEGLEVSHFQIARSGLISSPAVALRADPKRFAPRTIRSADYGWKRATAQAICKASGAAACINTNFFDEQGKPLGLAISRGIQHQKMHNGGGTLTGVFFVTNEGRLGIAHRGEFSAAGVVEALQAGPRLISVGAPVVGVKEASSATNISLVCIDGVGRLILMRVTLGIFGGTLREVQGALLRPELGCVEALNFDGGGSSQLYFSAAIKGHPGGIREEWLPGRDEVPVFLGLVPVGGSAG